MTDHGTYVVRDGRPAVRFERTYPHPIERVWQAVTDPTELTYWFPSPEVSYDARVGGRIELGGDPNIDSSEATVLAWDPPHRFAFQWGPDELHFTLESTADGCRFELVNVLSEQNTAARNAAGWEVCLAELGKLIAGTPGSGPQSEDTLPFDPLYDAYVAAGVPSGAAIPGR